MHGYQIVTFGSVETGREPKMVASANRGRHQIGDAVEPVPELGGLGLVIEVEGLSAAVVDHRGHVRSLHTTRDDLRSAPITQTSRELIRLVESGQAAADDLGLQLQGLCVAIPGDHDLSSDQLRFFPGLGWPDSRVDELLGPDLPGTFPAAPRIVTEAHAGALAAISDQPASSAAGLLYVSGTGAGLSGALVLDGRVYQGASGRTAEFGHIVVDPTGAACPCGGVGCLELTAGLQAILTAALGSRTADQQTDPLDALDARLRAGDRRALSAVTVAGMHLGTALASVTRLVDPDRVVIGGAYARLLPWLDQTLRAALALHAPSSPLLVGDHIAASPLGRSAALTGAAGLALGERERAPGHPRETHGAGRVTAPRPAR